MLFPDAASQAGWSASSAPAARGAPLPWACGRAPRRVSLRVGPARLPRPSAATRGRQSLLAVRPSGAAGRSGVLQAAAWRGPGGPVRRGGERGLGRRGPTCLQSPPGRPLSPHTLLEKPPPLHPRSQSARPRRAGTSLKVKCFPPQELEFEELPNGME